MGRLFIVMASYIALVVITISAFCFQINGHTTLEISTRLPVLLTPANYAYIILIFIYVLIAYWIIIYWKKRKTSESLTNLQMILFTLAAILQIIAIISWHYSQFTFSFSMQVLLIFTLYGLYFTYPLNDNKLSSRIPISLYFSWVTFSLLINSSFILTLREWHGLGLSNPLWAVIAMTIGTAIVLHIRYHHNDIAYPSVFIWAYLAVAIHNGFDELLVTTAALFLSGVMIVGILFIKKALLKSVVDIL